jgi:prepilin-type N-terminal cleavage/methylation domain-containing protein
VNNRGFTLVELLVGTVVVSILGIALVRMMLSDTRFVSRQEAMVSARQTARGTLNAMDVELRMISDGGLSTARPDSVRAHIPYAFGVACQSTGADRIIAALVPPDSLLYATAVVGGMAHQQTDGSYDAVDGVSVGNSSNFSACAADSIFVVPGGRLVQISGITGPLPDPGRILYLYQDVTYRFSNSTEIPGRLALWRKSGTAAYEEVAAPFDTSSGFRCLVGTGLQPTTCPPAGGVDSVRGLELRLVGASEHAPRGSDNPSTFELIARLPFLNKVN